MHSISTIALIASLVLCAADVSHLPLSRGYLPPLSGASGYSAYTSYPSYTGNSYYSGSRLGSGRSYTYNSDISSSYAAPVASSGYNSGLGSGYNSGLGSDYGASLVDSGYNRYTAVPQYNTYASPALTGYSGSGYAGSSYSGQDTKYAANGGYLY
ncbi:probable peroxisomal membrane protein PEX13 [Drosophila hydei]|uniref:Probable peroxisomal membrane protein PEX13 n=1 Tax=Drosophila hydei TaxID=7224 RepID=A0A6J2SMD8_DROHY|nr:probable peroxisomal membrane protein PEX13 [Drosophila hydei]